MMIKGIPNSNFDNQTSAGEFKNRSHELLIDNRDSALMFAKDGNYLEVINKLEVLPNRIADSNQMPNVDSAYRNQLLKELDRVIEIFKLAEGLPLV
jgi:hypothetical protein